MWGVWLCLLVSLWFMLLVFGQYLRTAVGLREVEPAGCVTRLDLKLSLWVVKKGEISFSRSSSICVTSDRHWFGV